MVVWLGEFTAEVFSDHQSHGPIYNKGNCNHDDRIRLKLMITLNDLDKISLLI